jgi:ketosteroid isomerase-like protein
MTGTGRWKRLAAGTALLAIFSLACSAAWGEQKKDKKKKGEAAASESFVSKLPEDSQVDMAIGEMLAAWQVGDLELLKKHYAEDVIVVSGAFAPPVVGLAKYVEVYQRQWAQVQQQNIERKNTLVVVRGNTAWATYQWTYVAQMNARVAEYQGHTSLVLEKRNGVWLIVHNHTSLVAPSATPQTAAADKQ